MRVILICLSLALSTTALRAQDAPLGLSAPETVTASGLLKHILPRFSLKTGVRVVPDADGALSLATEPPGQAVFQGSGVVYYLRGAETGKAKRFADWLTSDIGKRTVDSFAPGGAAPFSTDFAVAAVVEAPVFEGNAALGEKLSLTHCGRCHVVGPQNAKNSIGSTPSFAVLRTLTNWDERFQAFYVLRPHGAFTQIKDVTPPFAPELPSPIYPVEMTLDDLEAILAFVAVMKAADLGAPLQTQ